MEIQNIQFNEGTPFALGVLSDQKNTPRCSNLSLVLLLMALRSSF
jgi:hypothetical protein